MAAWDGLRSKENNSHSWCNKPSIWPWWCCYLSFTQKVNYKIPSRNIGW